MTSPNYLTLTPHKTKRGSGKWNTDIIPTLEVNGTTSILKNKITRIIDPKLREFMDEINIQTSVRSQELFYENHPVKTLAIILFPFAKFVKVFLLNLEFKKSVIRRVITTCGAILTKKVVNPT